MERNWTTVAEAHNGTPEQRNRLNGILARLEWLEIGEGIEMAMMPGMAIDAAIDQLSIPKVTHVATSNEMAPFGLCGIRGHYKNGRADVYIVDEGDKVTVLASDFYPNKQHAVA
jgi:hypothetical protein